MSTAVRNRTANSGAKSARAAPLALRVMAIFVGFFFLGMGLNKLAWLNDSNLLAQRFDIFAKGAPSIVGSYIETFAKPGAPVFARLVPIAELATAAALVLGFWTRLAALLALFMILNFHFATASFFHWEFLRDGTGPPLIGALLALAIAGSNLPWTVTKP
jgi:uncharacterized membrane protein YphA (DoxX/SURF4 family)